MASLMVKVKLGWSAMIVVLRLDSPLLDIINVTRVLVAGNTLFKES